MHHVARWERESCPLSGIEKRPPLGGYVRIKVMLDTIRNTTVVHCREAVLFSVIKDSLDQVSVAKEVKKLYKLAELRRYSEYALSY